MNTYQIISAARAKKYADIARGMEWAAGRARTAALTGTVKQNDEIVGPSQLSGLGRAIINNPGIQLNHMPLQCYPPKFSRYRDGQHYKRHTDAPWMGASRTDLSVTLWLTDDYEGGELLIGGRSFKGKSGQCIVYDCGEPHEVLPVTAGERICVITWVQSRVRDPIKRKWLSDMRKFLASFEDEQERFLEGSRLYSAMLRRWTE